MNKKRVLVYPCGTEIGLEIYRAICHCPRYELVGGGSTNDHGKFVYHEHIDNLPFIKDDSGREEIEEFEKIVSEHKIDFIYPAMDGVVAVFAKYRDVFSEVLISAGTDTANMCRSKKETYTALRDVVPVPLTYNSADEVTCFPVFMKPDKGQGSVGAMKVNDIDELKQVDFDKYVVMEFLPGKEYTIDCFTNAEGKLIYAKGRGRNRIKNGISVNAYFVDDPRFKDIAEKINSKLSQRGGWFFQLKESENGEFKLLEVAARIAGTSAISRNIGANLPLMSVDCFNGCKIDEIVLNDYNIILDRALENKYKTSLTYSCVYITYEDTLVCDNSVNSLVVGFLYQCLNQGKRIVLLSRFKGDLWAELKKYRISELFDEVVKLKQDEPKYEHIAVDDGIFIDDSYDERRMVKIQKGIQVFDSHMIECLNT